MATVSGGSAARTAKLASSVLPERRSNVSLTHRRLKPIWSASSEAILEKMAGTVSRVRKIGDSNPTTSVFGASTTLPAVSGAPFVNRGSLAFSAFTLAGRKPVSDKVASTIANTMGRWPDNTEHWRFINGCGIRKKTLSREGLRVKRNGGIRRLRRRGHKPSKGSSALLKGWAPILATFLDSLASGIAIIALFPLPSLPARDDPLKIQAQNAL